MSPTPKAESATLDEDLACPLCEYNLRGLSDLRCPECGTRFDWDELRDPTRKLHPYLFEHHPERNVSSFLQTLAGGLRPWRFWTTLLPVQPSRPKRVILYALICIGLMLPVAMSQFVRGVFEYHAYNLRERARMLPVYTGGATGIRPGVPVKSPREAFEQFRLRFVAVRKGQPVIDDARAQSLVHRYGSIQGFFDEKYPVLPSWKLIVYALKNPLSRWTWRGRPTGDLTEVIMAAAIWPWLTALGFQVFRATMRRARIRPTHLLRVAIYSGDIAVWLALALSIPILSEIFGNLSSSPGPRGAWVPPGGAGLSGVMYGIAFWTPLLAVFFACTRLVIAVQKYLRFRHAIATVIAVQIMVGLAMFKLFLMWNGY